MIEEVDINELPEQNEYDFNSKIDEYLEYANCRNEVISIENLKINIKKKYSVTTTNVLIGVNNNLGIYLIF